MNVQGDLLVKRSIDSKRVNYKAIVETLTTARSLTLHDFGWVKLINTAAQIVTLPDASTLNLGWKIVVQAGTYAATINTSDATLLKTINAGKAYEFTYVGVSTTVGTWHIHCLEEAVANSKYTEDFDATTDWGTAGSGYYTISILESTHDLGILPVVMVQELSGTDFINVEADRVLVSATGDVSIRVAETPDCRFAGRVIIM